MMITGTIRNADRGMFIEPDGDAARNIFLHVSIAERGGLVPPYEGRRVRAEISRDAFGNCAAVEVSELVGSPPAAGRAPIQVGVIVSPEEIGQLVQLGHLHGELCGEPDAIAEAVTGLMRRGLACRLAVPPAAGSQRLRGNG